MIAPLDGGEVTLVVLAGGRGQRLGGALKPLLVDASGESILARLLGVLGPAVEARQIVAPAPLHPAVSGVGAARVADPGEGPAWALLAAARAAATPWLLVVGGDHPAPSRRLYERLATAASAEAHRGAVRRAGRLEPLFALWRRSSLLAVGAAEPPRALQALASRVGAAVALAAEVLGEEEAAALADVDTRADVAAHGLRWPPEV